MNLSILESINLLILDDTQRHNRDFITQATNQWDIDGQGCFAEYLKRYIALCWYQMVMRN